MRRLFRVKRDLTGNLPGLPAVFPDTMAPKPRTAPRTSRKNYNFPKSHHTTTKTQTLIPTASNTRSTAPIISPNPPQQSQ
jgi:hypothetical protein